MLSNFFHGVEWLCGTGLVVLVCTIVFLLIHCIMYQWKGIKLYKILFNLMDNFDKFMSDLLLG